MFFLLINHNLPEEDFDQIETVFQRVFAFIEYEVKEYDLPNNISSWNPASLDEIGLKIRRENNLGASDNVVILSTTSDYENWFSRFTDNNNIYVHCDSWELFSPAKPEFPIAYQIAENIFQSKMDIKNIQDTCIHLEAIGCMNDLCADKSKIMLKLLTADICPTCINRLIDKRIERFEILNLIQSFETIAWEIKNNQRAKSKLAIGPSPISVSKDLVISLVDFKIILDFPPRHKALYLFYLKRCSNGQQGLTREDLADYMDELLDIYLKCRGGNIDQVDARNIVTSIIENGSIYSELKSRINSIIRKSTPAETHIHYIISGERDEHRAINFDPEQIDLRY